MSAGQSKASVSQPVSTKVLNEGSQYQSKTNALSQQNKQAPTTPPGTTIKATTPPSSNSKQVQSLRQNNQSHSQNNQNKSNGQNHVKSKSKKSFSLSKLFSCFSVSSSKDSTSSSTVVSTSSKSSSHYKKGNTSATNNTAPISSSSRTQIGGLKASSSSQQKQNTPKQQQHYKSQDSAILDEKPSVKAKDATFKEDPNFVQPPSPVLPSVTTTSPSSVHHPPSPTKHSFDQTRQLLSKARGKISEKFTEGSSAEPQSSTTNVAQPLTRNATTSPDAVIAPTLSSASSGTTSSENDLNNYADAQSDDTYENNNNKPVNKNEGSGNVIYQAQETGDYQKDDSRYEQPVQLGYNPYDEIVNEDGYQFSSLGESAALLNPPAPELAGRKCLVLDLDETLVHSSFKYLRHADFIIPVEIDSEYHNVYVIKRPGVDEFMRRVGELYEVVVFTASVSRYGDPLLDQLDIHNVIHHRLFRESCYNHEGNYVKNLSVLGRPLVDTIIIDNSPTSYIFHPQHAIPVSSWFSDIHDNELLDMIPFLEDLASDQVADVTLALDVNIDDEDEEEDDDDEEEEDDCFEEEEEDPSHNTTISN